MSEKPKSVQKELDKAQEQFDNFDKQVKEVASSDIAPVMHAKVEVEEQTKLSNREAQKADAPYIKPSRTMSSKEKFNETYRSQYDFAKKYIKCIVENYEIIGEQAEFWTKPFPGLPAEFWQVPVNKPVYIPRYAAQRLTECKYRRLIMEEDKRVSSDGNGTYYGQMAVAEVKRRLDCREVGSGFVAMGS